MRCASVFRSNCIRAGSREILARVEVYDVIRRAGIRGWIGYLLRKVAGWVDGLESIHIHAATSPQVDSGEIARALTYGLHAGLERASELLSRLQEFQFVDQAMKTARPNLFQDADRERQ